MMVESGCDSSSTRPFSVYQAAFEVSVHEKVGVATLSPSTSDSSAESSVSPYSPCSYDLSSDGSSSSISSSTGSGGVGLVPSCSSASTLSVSGTPPPPTLHPQVTPPATLLGHPIMTAVSAVLASSVNNNKGSATVTPSTSLPVTNYISFQVPNKSHTTSSNQQQSPRKPINFKNSITPKLNNSPLKGTTAKTLNKTNSIQVIGSLVKIPATGNSTNSNLPNSAKNSGVKSNCDAIRPSGSQNLNCATLSKLNSSIITSTGSIQTTTTASTTPKTISPSNVKSPSTGSNCKSKGTIKNIFAVALNFQQQQQKTKSTESATTNPDSKTTVSNSSNLSLQKPMTTATTINNNNSTTLNKNHTTSPSSNSITTNNVSTDLKLANMKQPYVKVTNIKGVSSTTKNGTKSFILHGEGQKNKVIIVSLASSKGDESKMTPVQSSSATAVVQSPSDLLQEKSATPTTLPSSACPQVIKVLAAKSLVSPLSYSNNNSNVVVVKSTAVLPTSSEPRDRPTSPKKPRLTTMTSSPVVNSTSPSKVASPKKFSHNIFKSSATTELSNPCATSIKVELIQTEKLVTSASKTSSISGSPNSSMKNLPSIMKPQEDSSPSSLVIDKMRNRKRKLTCCSDNGGCGGPEQIGRQFLQFESSSSLLVNSTVSSSSFGTVTSAQKSCFSLSASNLSAPGPFSSNLSDCAKQQQPETMTSTEAGCMWKSCCTSGQLGLNLLEHIQTVHVTGQVKSEGYVCLWEGCKVYNKKSSSLSWLERHVLSHSGNKPFKCIFPGCGLSFSAHGALQRHVNSHISTNEISGGPNSGSMTNRKLDSSPLKASRRKKQRCRKQRLNIGQYVDYFDKRVMEVIKHRLVNSVDFHTVNAHDCTFRGQVIARRTSPHHETQVLVHWYPESIISDEWVAEKKFKDTKLVPLTRIPKEKLSLLFPTLLPSPKREKQSRKLQSSSAGSSTSSAYGSASPSPLTLSSSSPSPSSSTDSECLMDVVKSEFIGKLDEDEGIANCERKRRRKKSSFGIFDQFDEEDDWAMDLLKDELFPLT